MNKHHIALPYLWHYVPDNMKGNYLWPLAELATRMPQVAALQAKKYDDRQYMQKMHIPLLDCEWKQAIFLSATHPKDVYEGFRQAGLSRRPKKAFQIPVEALAGYEVAWVDLTVPNEQPGALRLSESAVSKFDLSTYRSRPLSPASLEYFKAEADKGKIPLELLKEPHVVLRAYDRARNLPIPFDISGIDIITISGVEPSNTGGLKPTPRTR